MSRPGEIVARANANSLVLDIETSHIFHGVDTSALTLDEAKKRVLDALTTEVGAVTLDFDPREHEVVDMPMPCGSFVVFSERVMHGSSGNHAPRRRLAINGRYTRADTHVYPVPRPRRVHRRLESRHLEARVRARGGTGVARSERRPAAGCANWVESRA